MTSKGKDPVSVLEAFESGTCKPKALVPFERLIFAVIAEEVPINDAEAAFIRLRDAFINWNEMRVARWVEIARALDPLPEADARAMRLRKMLNRLFELRGAMVLDFLPELKVTEARKTLLDLDENLPRQEISLILYEMVPGTTIPLSPEGLKVARKYGLVGRTGNKNQLQKLLATECDPVTAARLVHYLELEGNPNPVIKKKSKKTVKKTKKK